MGSPHRSEFFVACDFVRTDQTTRQAKNENIFPVICHHIGLVSRPLFFWERAVSISADGEQCRPRAKPSHRRSRQATALLEDGTEQRCVTVLVVLIEVVKRPRRRGRGHGRGRGRAFVRLGTGVYDGTGRGVARVPVGHGLVLRGRCTVVRLHCGRV